MSTIHATSTTNMMPTSAPPHLQSHNRTMSTLSTEDLFSSITGFDDLAGDDDLSFDDIEDDDITTAGGENGNKKTGKKGGKLRNSSNAEKKATHNAVERARRESLNARFLVLADMLPGMTHVKRASKAAIVNKSIEFIRDIHKAENRLVKENDALKAELEALRQRVNASQPSGQAGNNGAAASALGLANVNAAHAAAAAAAAGMPQHMQQHHLFPGMHPMQMQMPMMPHLPAAMATVAAAAAAHNNGNPTLGSAIHQSLPPAPKAENAHNHAQQQQQQSAPPSAGLPAQSNAELGQHLFPGIFTGLFNAGGAFDNMEHSRSESGSPTGSSISQSQQQQHQPGSRNGGSGQFAHGLFELPAMSGFATEGGNKVGGSPASYNSPPGTVASLAGSERTSQSQQSNSQLTSNTAPSPASSHSVPTPVNSYSPINLPGLTATPQSAHSLASQAQGMTDPAIAAFDGSADAAYLAAQFAPNDLAKAQHELHAFIAYQQRMAYAGQSGAQQQQQQPSPTNGNGQMSPTLFPPHGSFSYQQQQQQQMMPFGGVCGPNSQTGMPAWQMMMAQQQQAMVAAYGQQGHF